MTMIGPKAEAFLERRGISTETALQFGIHTGRWDVRTAKLVDDSAGNVIAFPYRENGRVVSEKYRALDGKRFWQLEGGRKTFWNADKLDDPAFVEGRMSIIICEGEMDALAAISCGFPLAVSVPEGAPGIPNGRKPEDLDPYDPKDDEQGKFAFVHNNADRLYRRSTKFIIAVDSDDPGRRLAAELVRRLNASRCSWITYPDGCKDLNDVLMKHGPEAVALALNNAKPYPVRGLYRYSDYPPRQELATFDVGWPGLDKYLRVWPGELMVVTGIPSHGKSVFVINLAVNLAQRHGWHCAMFSPEIETVPMMRDMMRKIVSSFGWTENDSWDFCERYFLFIDNDPRAIDDLEQEDFTLDFVLGRAEEAVLRDGIKLLVIDPWNEMEPTKQKSESTTEYIGRAIRKIKRFARLYGVMTIIVAHPTKVVVDAKGKTRTPTLYDIDGSAHYFNKSDHGLILDRVSAAGGDLTTVTIAKVRFQPETGLRAAVEMEFDRTISKFSPSRVVA